MAAMNFPDNPTLNQEFTNEVGRTWIWTGTSWVSKTVNFNAYLADSIDVHGISNTALLVYQSDLESKQNVVPNVTDYEIAFLANVTSDIQGQLDNKANSTHSHVIEDIANVTVSVSELNTLDGITSNVQSQLNTKAEAVHSHAITDISNVTVSTAEINILDGAIIDVTELNYLDGVTSNIQGQIDGKANASHTHLISDITNVAVSTTEINYLLGATSNVQSQIDGKAPVSHSHVLSDIANVTTSLTELNYLDGVTSNVQAQIDGKASSSHTHVVSDLSNVTATATELNYLSGVTSNVQSQIDGKANTTHTHVIGDIANVTVDVAELNYLDGVTSNVQSQLNGKADFSHTHQVSDLANVTASATELNILDNATVTTTELNYLSGVTSNIQAQVNGKLSLSGGTMTGKITLDGDPTQALHAVTKQYVDNLEAGLIAKPQVIAATTTNLDATYYNGPSNDGVGATLTATSNVAFPLIDNVAVTTTSGFRGVLVKNQTNAAHNGRYNLTTQGSASDPWILTRCGLCNEADEIPGGYIFVTDGSVNGQTGWVLHVDDPATFVVGTDDIDAFQFSGAGAIVAGTNILVDGSEVSVVDNPSFANLTVTSSVVLTNATVTGLEVSDLSDVTINTAASGDVLYWNGSGWVNKYVNQIPAKISTPTITANNYTLTSGDDGMILEITSNVATTVTIPTSETFANGTQMIVMQAGSGEVSVIAQNTAVQTFNYSPGNKLRSQWSAATLLKRNTNNWVLYGDLIA